MRRTKGGAHTTRNTQHTCHAPLKVGYSSVAHVCTTAWGAAHTAHAPQPVGMRPRPVPASARSPLPRARLTGGLSSGTAAIAIAAAAAGGAEPAAAAGVLMGAGGCCCCCAPQQQWASRQQQRVGAPRHGVERSGGRGCQQHGVVDCWWSWWLCGGMGGEGVLQAPQTDTGSHSALSPLCRQLPTLRQHPRPSTAPASASPSASVCVLCPSATIALARYCSAAAVARPARSRCATPPAQSACQARVSASQNPIRPCPCAAAHARSTARRAELDSSSSGSTPARTPPLCT
jgi:hypothetical protein